MPPSGASRMRKPGVSSEPGLPAANSSDVPGTAIGFAEPRSQSASFSCTQSLGA